MKCQSGSRFGLIWQLAGTTTHQVSQRAFCMLFTSLMHPRSSDLVFLPEKTRRFSWLEGSKAACGYSMSDTHRWRKLECPFSMWYPQSNHPGSTFETGFCSWLACSWCPPSRPSWSMGARPRVWWNCPKRLEMTHQKMSQALWIMEVSWNADTPKSFISIGCSTRFWSTTISGTPVPHDFSFWREVLATSVHIKLPCFMMDLAGPSNVPTYSIPQPPATLPRPKKDNPKNIKKLNRSHFKKI